MFCPLCGAADQMADAYCKRCGEWLPDLEAARRGGFGGVTPEQNIFTSLFLSTLSAAAALFSAIALYATYFGDGKWSVYFAAGVCLCIAGWQASNLVVILKLRRRFKRGRAGASPTLQARGDQAFLNRADTSSFVKAQSITENTTDLLEPLRSVPRQKSGDR